MNSSAKAAPNTPAILKMLEIYAGAFAEHEAARRQEMLTRCLAPDAAIWGHSHVFAGYAAISEKIAGFQQNFPDCRLTLASGLFAFDNIVRFATAIVGPDGAVRARGETVMEFGEDGRIRRVVPLWDMKLPPLRDGWPERLAGPPANSPDR